MEHRDKKYGFSLEVPNGWKKAGKLYCFFRDKRVVLFPKTTPNSILSLENPQDNLLYSFMQSGYEAGISIVCLPPVPELNDPQKRNKEMYRQVLRAQGFAFYRDSEINECNTILRKGLGREENTTHVWFDFAYQQPINHAILKVSTIHNNIDYILTFGGPVPKYKEGLKSILESFKFS